jgi:hypothetical protein
MLNKLSVPYAILVGLAGLSAPIVLAAEITIPGGPPETPATTANQFYACMAKNGVEREQYEAAIEGLTAAEYVAIGRGCVAMQDERLLTRCSAAYDKLRPLFRHDGPPETLPLSLSAAEFLAMEAGCSRLSDGQEKTGCLTGVRKLSRLPVSREPPNAPPSRRSTDKAE